MTTTLDPATLGAHSALSNGNLTVTKDATLNDSGAFSTTSKASGSGKWYMEITVNNQDGGGNTGFGIAIAGTTFSAFGSSATGGVALFKPNIYVNGTNDGNAGAGSPATGDVIGMLLDTTSLKIQFNNITHSLTGTQFTYPNLGAMFFCLDDNGSSGQLTVNFGASAFSASLPVGYTAWDTGVPARPYAQARVIG